MKSILASLVLIFSTSAVGQVVSVNVFEPLAGKAPLTGQYFREAREILQAAGAGVAISNDLSGKYRFAVVFEDWESYGNWYNSLANIADWAAFQGRTSANPSALQTDNILLDGVSVAPAGGGPGAVTQVTVWQVTTGTMQQLVQGGINAKPIHERAGSAVSVYTSGNNIMYYLQRYDSMADWGRDRDTPNPEFNEYMQSLMQENNGNLGAEIIDQFTLTAM